MSVETKAGGNGNRTGKDRRKTLRQIVADAACKAGGGLAVRSAFLRGKIHRGCSLWLGTIRPTQEAWARFLGYPCFDQLPVREKEDIRDLIADELFTMFYQPSGEAPGMIKEYRAALNHKARLRQSLAARRRDNKADLPAMFAGVN